MFSRRAEPTVAMAGSPTTPQPEGENEPLFKAADPISQYEEQVSKAGPGQEGVQPRPPGVTGEE